MSAIGSVNVTGITRLCESTNILATDHISTLIPKHIYLSVTLNKIAISFDPLVEACSLAFWPWFKTFRSILRQKGLIKLMLFVVYLVGACSHLRIRVV